MAFLAGRRGCGECEPARRRRSQGGVARPSCRSREPVQPSPSVTPTPIPPQRPHARRSPGRNASATSARPRGRRRRVLRCRLVRLEPHAVKTVTQAVPLLLKFPMEHFSVDYDREADVLYISFRRPQKATDTRMTDEGLLLRITARNWWGSPFSRLRPGLKGSQSFRKSRAPLPCRRGGRRRRRPEQRLTRPLHHLLQSPPHQRAARLAALSAADSGRLVPP